MKPCKPHIENKSETPKNRHKKQPAFYTTYIGTKNTQKNIAQKHLKITHILRFIWKWKTPAQPI